MNEIRIKSALISVFYKTGLEVLIKTLRDLGVTMYSTGGTYDFILSHGCEAILVEDLTGFPAMLDGRVKTLHPAVFAGILAKRNEDHLSQLQNHNLPQIDLVVVDLYPFEEAITKTDDENLIIEKIDIGGVSLLRAAAKNYTSVAVVCDSSQYNLVNQTLLSGNGHLDDTFRRNLAFDTFTRTSQYDTAISNYFGQISGKSPILRYGENPHQKASFTGDLSKWFSQLSGKDLSYNNLVDIDAAIQIIYDFRHNDPTFVIIKHTNPCGIATRNTTMEAWKTALACDPSSAFGGIIICNQVVSVDVATEIDQLFYEVLIAPDYDNEALQLLKKKKNRIILKLNGFNISHINEKSILGGRLIQESDFLNESAETLLLVTNSSNQISEADLRFGIKCVKHLKSNAIAIIKNQQLIGAGQGQTSRVAALEQAIQKSRSQNFDLSHSILVSDAFFPFADSVAQAAEAGIKVIVQPGGSVRDQESIDYCNEAGIAMYFTGIRHFKH